MSFCPTHKATKNPKYPPFTLTHSIAPSTPFLGNIVVLEIFWKQIPGKNGSLSDDEGTMFVSRHILFF